MSHVETATGNPRYGVDSIPRDPVAPQLPAASVDTADMAAIRIASENQEYEHFLGVRAAGLTSVMAVNDDPAIQAREATRFLNDVGGESLDEKAKIVERIIEQARLNGAVEANIILRAQRDVAIDRAEAIVALVRAKHPELIPELGTLIEKPIAVPSDLVSATAVIEQVLAASAAKELEAIEEQVSPAHRMADWVRKAARPLIRSLERPRPGQETPEIV